MAICMQIFIIALRQYKLDSSTNRTNNSTSQDGDKAGSRNSTVVLSFVTGRIAKYCVDNANQFAQEIVVSCKNREITLLLPVATVIVLTVKLYKIPSVQIRHSIALFCATGRSNTDGT